MPTTVSGVYHVCSGRCFHCCANFARAPQQGRDPREDDGCGLGGNSLSVMHAETLMRISAKASVRMSSVFTLVVELHVALGT